MKKTKTETMVTPINPHPLLRLPETLVFVRHGQSVGNIISRDERAKHHLANHAYPITEEGKRQAKKAAKLLAERFSKDFFESCFASTYERTKQTLSIILKHSGMENEMLEDSRLDEKWDGIYHDLPLTEADERYPEQRRLFDRMGYYHFRALSGQNGADIETSIRSFINDLYVAGQKKVLCACSGSWLLLARRLLEGWSVKEYLSRRSTKDEIPANCSIYIYRTKKPCGKVNVKNVSTVEILNQVQSQKEKKEAQQKTELA